MSIRMKRGWEIPESQVTPETIYLNRRKLLAGGSVLAAGAAAGLILPMSAADAAMSDDPSAGLYPAKVKNPTFVAGDRMVTPEDVNTHFNNFYEYGESKQIFDNAQNLKIRPWEVTIDGMVETPFKIGIDDLLAKVSLEERVYRHRCVEAWSMVVPWTGFPLKALVDLAKPLGSAKYLRMETFNDPSMASGQALPFYPWPYVEGLTMAEATNDLAFMVTGAYGKPVAKSMGAPLRIHLPWKYGFKSIKSIVKFSFVEERPVNFWQEINSHEYGFWANVNPAVPHPRWSQAMERDIGTNQPRPTVIFNGYGDFVADLYKGMENEPLYM